MQAKQTFQRLENVTSWGREVIQIVKYARKINSLARTKSGVVSLVARGSGFRCGCQLPVGLLIVEDEFFDLRRVAVNKASGSLHVC